MSDCRLACAGPETQAASKLTPGIASWLGSRLPTPEEKARLEALLTVLNTMPNLDDSKNEPAHSELPPKDWQPSLPHARPTAGNWLCKA